MPPKNVTPDAATAALAPQPAADTPETLLLTLTGTTGVAPNTQPFQATYNSSTKTFTLLPPEGQAQALSFTLGDFVTWLQGVIPGTTFSLPDFSSFLPGSVAGTNIVVQELVVSNNGTPIYVNFSGGLKFPSPDPKISQPVNGFSITGIGVAYTQGTAPS